MDIEEFERQVVTGEITDSNTDFEYYFKEAQDDDIRTMQRICIENNVYKKAYPDWAEEFVTFETEEELQFLLLDNNHCLDILICSENKEVRREVVEKDIKYAFEDHVMEYDQDIIIDILMREIEPHAELLDTFLECQDGSWGAQDLQALELKQKARTIVPAIIEKTMTPLQLFEAGNPLWTKTLTGYQVRNVIQARSPKYVLFMQQNSK